MVLHEREKWIGKSRSCKRTKEGVHCTILFGAFQVTRPPCCIHHTETDWADLQSCPVNPQASCSLSASHNNVGITQTGEVWEPTKGVHPGRGRDCGVGWGGGVGREGGVKRVFGEGDEDPLLNFTWSFQMREKAEWCPLSLCHTGTFKKQPQWFLKWGVFSRDKKEEKNEWVKNLMAVLCEGLAVGGWPL